MTIATAIVSSCIPSSPAAAEDSSKSAKVAEDAARPAAARPANLEEIISEMPQESLQEAFRILRTDYIQKDRLTYLELNRSALQGLLGRMEFGATLLNQAGRAAQNSPFGFHSQVLERHVAYVRPGKFASDEIDQLDAALKGFDDNKLIETLIVDLRSPQRQADFQIAARFLSRFSGSGDLLFKITRPGETRPTLFLADSEGARWTRDVLVLVDSETGNVGEIVAAVLRRDRKAMIIGETTLGLTVEYRDVSLGEDRFLRYAVAEVLLDDDTSLFRTGVTPDLPSPANKKNKHEVFRAAEGGDLNDFLKDPIRPRMNEAALVAGTNPELSYLLAKNQGKATPYDKPPLQDRVLQQALDFLDTTRFLHSDADVK